MFCRYLTPSLNAFHITNVYSFFSVGLYVLERKLASGEFPHNLYIQNYTTSSATCITLKRWLFSFEKEKALYEDPVALDFFFWQVCYILYSPICKL